MNTASRLESRGVPGKIQITAGLPTSWGLTMSWQFFSRIAGVTPFAYAVWWKENVFLGMIVDGLLNTIGVITVEALVLGQLR